MPKSATRPKRHHCPHCFADWLLRHTKRKKVLRSYLAQTWSILPPHILAGLLESELLADGFFEGRPRPEGTTPTTTTTPDTDADDGPLVWGQGADLG